MLTNQKVERIDREGILYNIIKNCLGSDPEIY